MPRILFTTTPKIPRDKLDEWKYKIGDIVELTVDEGERWIRRGVADWHTAADSRRETLAAKAEGKTKEELQAEVQAKAEAEEAEAKQKAEAETQAQVGQSQSVVAPSSLPTARTPSPSLTSTPRR